MSGYIVQALMQVVEFDIGLNSGVATGINRGSDHNFGFLVVHNDFFRFQNASDQFCFPISKLALHSGARFYLRACRSLLYPRYQNFAAKCHTFI